MSLFNLLLIMMTERMVFFAKGQLCQKDMEFIKQETRGKALIGHTFKTEPATSVEFCQALCFMNMERGCISVTFDTQKMLCNLSDSDQFMHPEHLVDASNAIFLNSENTCNCTSKNMSCGYSVTLGDYHCYCKLGYGGHNCETDLKLVALYPMNARYQARSVQADSPDGVISNVDCAVDPSSPLGGSCTFKGLPNSYIEIPNQENGKLDVKGSMTLLAFISAEAPGPIFQYSANVWGVHWWITSGLRLYIRMQKRDLILPPDTQKPIAKGNWMYVGTTYDRSTGVNNLWIEGEKVSSVSPGIMDLATQFEVRIGVRNSDSRYLKGKIACIQVYKEALNEFQIKEARHHCDRFV